MVSSIQLLACIQGDYKNVPIYSILRVFEHLGQSEAVFDSVFAQHIPWKNPGMLVLVLVVVIFNGKMKGLIGQVG